MKRSLYLMPLMAFTAMTLVLAGCDDNTADNQTTDASQTAPAGDEAATSVMPTTTDTAAPAADTAAGGMITAEGANAYATADAATTGAIFLTLHNPGSEADRLVGASTPNASTVELHENTVGADGTMQMRPVDGIDIPAGQQVSLSPNGYHIMLMGLTAPLMQGQNFNVTLDFENAPDVTVPVMVTAPGGGAATGTDGTASSMDHGGHDAATGMGGDTTSGGVPAMDEPVSGTTGTDTSADGTGMSGTTATGAAGTAGDTPSYGSTMPGEAAESSPSATTDTPTADVPAGQ